jgi:hypothetical protein
VRALHEGSSGLPIVDVRIKLRPASDRSDKHVDTGELGDVVTSCNKKFLVASDADAKVSKLVKLGQGGSTGWRAVSVVIDS